MHVAVSRQCCEVWASQFPFLHSLRDVIPPSETCCMAILTGLWHRLSTSILWVCLSLFLLRGMARPGHGLGSISQCRRDLCQYLVVHLWLRRITWRVALRLIQVARSLLVAVSPPVLPTLGRKRSMGVGIPDVSWSSTFSSSSSEVFQVGMLFRFFAQWRSITSNRFVLNMVLDDHLKLQFHPPLFHNFQQFNVKVATTHHPIIQKEVDELLAKGVIEPSSGGAGFYSSVLVVCKHTGGLQPILTLKHFNYYMHVPSFKMPAIRHVQQLIQHDDYAFSIDLQDAYLHIPIVKHHHCLAQCALSVVGFAFWDSHSLWVFTALTKPILFLCICKGFCIVIYFG